MKDEIAKEFYRLWWEYLIRSDVYKELCKKIRYIKKLRNDGSAVPAEGNLKLIDSAVTKGHYAVSDSLMAGPDYDSEFYMLHKYYPHFGDAFLYDDFEEVWQQILSFQQFERPDFIKWDSGSIGESFGFAKLKSKGSANEKFIELGSERAVPMHFQVDEDRFPLGDMGTYLCYIDFKADKEKLLHDFRNFLNMNWKNYNSPIKPRFLSRMPVDTQLDNLWRYLKVFDATKQNIDDQLIAQKLFRYTEEESYADEASTRVKREYNAAENVIWNIEHGLFPKVSK